MLKKGKKLRIASPGSMQDTGCLGLVHWDDPEGWYWEGGRRGVQDGVAICSNTDGLHYGEHYAK